MIPKSRLSFGDGMDVFIRYKINVEHSKLHLSFGFGVGSSF
jgi:hypothetical protein